MKIYTRNGDRGETALWGGKRTSKADLKVECYGTIDEASSCLGLARGMIKSDAIKGMIVDIQKSLQILAAEVASTPEGLLKLKERIEQEDISKMEKNIDFYWEGRPKITGFVLPGGTVGSGILDLARTIVRRAERLVVALTQQQEVREEILSYLNRLSDLLFVLARVEGDEELVQIVKDKVLQQLDQKSFNGLNRAIARKLIGAAEAKAEELGVQAVFSVVDAAGNLLLLERQEEAILASINISWGKAYTAAITKMPTHALAEVSQPGQPLYGIEVTNEGRLVIFGGGFPLTKDSKLFGAIGVSGGTAEQDKEIALAAVSCWEEYAKD